MLQKCQLYCESPRYITVSMYIVAHSSMTLKEYVTLSIKLDALSPSSKMREGLADVISMHEKLTNQILLFHSETVATPWLQYVRLVLV